MKAAIMITSVLHDSVSRKLYESHKLGDISNADDIYDRGI
jgi:hypothetical protein